MEEYDDQYGYLTMKAKDPVKYGTVLLTGVGVLQTCNYLFKVVVSFNLHRATEENNTVKMNKLAVYQRITAFTFLFGAGILAYRCYLLYKSIPEEVLQERIVLQRDRSQYELQQRAEAS